MRIIGGEWRGRKIEEPRGRDVTRPTTDRVREACASMVMSAFDFDLDEVRVLDAFGGSGALGIEMLSRGARSLTTFEIDRNAARLITKNIESLCRDRARWRVVTGDVLASASRGRVPGGPFDLVLLDPPYAFGAEPVEELLQNLAQQGLLAQGAYALFEHAAADTGPGGQGVNTTDSAVRMKHIPSGITVTARESRSQFQNRSSCLRKLRAELERRGRPPRRRVKTKVPQRSRQRRLNDKHFNAIKKANRRKPGSDE